MGPRQFTFIMLLGILPPDPTQQRPSLPPTKCTTVTARTWLIVMSFHSSHLPVHPAISTIISLSSLCCRCPIRFLFCSRKIPSHTCLISLDPFTFQLVCLLYQSKGSGFFLLNTFSWLIAIIPLPPPCWLSHKQPDNPCIAVSVHWECTVCPVLVVRDLQYV